MYSSTRCLYEYALYVLYILVISYTAYTVYTYLEAIWLFWLLHKWHLCVYFVGFPFNFTQNFISNNRLKY